MKIDLHVHTCETSPCGKVKAVEMLHLYKAAGYDAVVVTDHFNDYVLEKFPADRRIDEYLSGYRTAVEYAKKVGIKVFFGVETCLLGGKDDFLIYGVTPQFLYDNPKLYALTLAELYDTAHKAGGIVIQAHPNRGYCRQADIRYLDGVEVYNGNPRHDSHNDITRALADRHPELIPTSGNDFHQIGDEKMGGGIIAEVRDEKELAEKLKKREYEVLSGSE